MPAVLSWSIVENSVSSSRMVGRRSARPSPAAWRRGGDRLQDLDHLALREGEKIADARRRVQGEAVTVDEAARVGHHARGVDAPSEPAGLAARTGSRRPTDLAGRSAPERSWRCHGRAGHAAIGRIHPRHREECARHQRDARRSEPSSASTCRRRSGRAARRLPGMTAKETSVRTRFSPNDLSICSIETDRAHGRGDRGVRHQVLEAR